jgi:hypothetical protein
VSELPRDEFSEKTKRVLAQRAAYRCSDPSCRAPTVFPHADETKSVLTGVAAHICAAAAGGPRYEGNQSPEERRSPSNGIWLCHSHSDRVDKDEQRYPAPLLRRWKTEHEQWVSGLDLVPAPPRIALSTLQGLMLPLGPGAVDATLTNEFRDHTLELSAGSRHEIQHLMLRVQFPESVTTAKILEAPVGVGVQVRPEQQEMIAVVSGSGSVEQHGTAHPSNVFIVEVERLGPSRPVRVAIRTKQDFADQCLRRAQELIGSPGDLFSFVEGSFLYPDGGQFYERMVVYPIEATGERAYAVAPPEEPGQHTRFGSNFHGQPTTVSTGEKPFSGAAAQEDILRTQG